VDWSRGQDIRSVAVSGTVQQEWSVPGSVAVLGAAGVQRYRGQQEWTGFGGSRNVMVSDA